jgi:signal transduction histidine kinase
MAAAADAERRRIERDLHDGVQQHLVALIVNLQLARRLADSDPAATKAALEEMGRDARNALEGVRDLAAGIYPPLLLGLAEALRTAASEAGLPAKVEAALPESYPSEIETAVYLCCREGLRNAAEHAGAGARAVVRAWRDQDALLFEIVDDGLGFDERATRQGTGLNAIGDRVGALGGSLTITSEPGRGTRVAGRIPLAL